MTGASIRIKSNEPQVAADLGRISDVVGDLMPVLADIGDAMVFATQRRFETKVDPEGQSWRPLAPRTARERAKRGHDPSNILRDSNRLYNSITRVVENAGVTASVEWGTNVVYAAAQQFGRIFAVAPRSQPIYRFYDKRTDTFDPRFRSRARSNFMTWVEHKAHAITIPARAYLGVNDADRVTILDITADHLRRAIGGEQ